MAEIDYPSVFTFLQQARERIQSGAPAPFSEEQGQRVLDWLRNKAALDQRASVKNFSNNVC